MSTLRRIALGFPITWSHRRSYRFDALERPGEAPYFIEWDPSHGVYGEDWTDAPFDSNGVLLSRPGRCYHPIRIAQFALHRYGVWRETGEKSARADFLAQAAWLRDNQSNGESEGSYRFSFPWTKYGADSGWSSAMAQGEAISVLLRADSLQPLSGFARAAENAVRPFAKDISMGGVVWRNGADVFFEEIATEHAPHVLNGCIFALWGVWELAQRSGESTLNELIDSCADTLRRWLPRFDTGWWTRYSLLESADGRPHVATLKYHQFHIAQMLVLSRMFDEEAFEAAAHRWSSYVERTECRARVLGAALQSLPERFLGRDTVVGGARS